MITKAVLFDIGGTIVHSKKNNEIWASKLINYLTNFDIIISDSPLEFANYFKTQMEEFKKYASENNYIDIFPYELITNYVLKKYIKESDLPTLKIIANNIINIYMREKGFFLQKGTRKTLSKLSKKYKLGIISNTPSLDYVVIRLFKTKMFKYFNEECIFLSSKSQMRKPNKNIFLIAAKSLGVLPNECIYIGDTISRDVIGATNANYQAVIRIGKLNEKVNSPDTKYLINKFTEIPKMIKKINL